MDHLEYNGWDYFSLVISCPVCLEHGRFTNRAPWYHDKCGGQMYLGTNGFLRCIKCGEEHHITEWEWSCDNCAKELKGNVVSLGVGRKIPNALSAVGQLVDAIGMDTVNTLINNITRHNVGLPPQHNI